MSISRSAAAAPPPLYLHNAPRELPIVHRDSNGRWIVPGSPQEDIQRANNYNYNSNSGPKTPLQGISKTPTAATYSAADFVMENVMQDPTYRLQERMDAGSEDLAFYTALRDGNDSPVRPGSAEIIVTPSRAEACHAETVREQALAVSLKDLNFYMMLARGQDPTTLPGAAAQPSQPVGAAPISKKEPLVEDCLEDTEAMKADIDFFMTLMKA